MSAEDLTVDLEVERVKRVTDKALLCEIDGVEYWIPKSQIQDGGAIDGDAEEGAEGDIIVTAWWAHERRLD